MLLVIFPEAMIIIFGHGAQLPLLVQLNKPVKLSMHAWCPSWGLMVLWTWTLLNPRLTWFNVPGSTSFPVSISFMPICLPSHFLSLHHCQNPPKAFMEVPNFSHSRAWNHVKPDHHSYPHVPSCIPIAHSSLNHRGYSLSPLIPCMYLIPYHPCPHALTHYSPIFFLTLHHNYTHFLLSHTHFPLSLYPFSMPRSPHAMSSR